jgi:DNA-binding ferritin-like protein (Dps family)
MFKEFIVSLDDRVKKLIKVLTLIEKGKKKEAEELIGDDAILRTCVELVSPCLSEIMKEYEETLSRLLDEENPIIREALVASCELDFQDKLRDKLKERIEEKLSEK